MDAEIYTYTLCARLCGDAIAEYNRHMANTEYVNPNMSYASQVEDLTALRFLTSGDRDYAASFAPGADRSKLLAQASIEYRQALSAYERTVMRYYIEAQIIPKVFTSGRIDVDKLDDDTKLDQAFARYSAAVQAMDMEKREYEQERAEYGRFLGRSSVRLQQLTTHAPKSILETR
jgi:hypothetical protein